ncbi:hypothetical protein KEM48_006163 [Puccinia striiformis f. sp. tritici PST-130]|nr:hypothetical protein KEM48_006163 [Puccinia striiformis f. sp. tritici PST-130]
MMLRAASRSYRSIITKNNHQRSIAIPASIFKQHELMVKVSQTRKLKNYLNGGIFNVNRIDSDRETIIKLLYSIASKHEVERYLRIFSSANTFAVLKVGGAILNEDLESLR